MSIELPLRKKIYVGPMTGREKRAKSVPPKSDGFVTNIDTAFIEKILHISK